MSPVCPRDPNPAHGLAGKPVAYKLMTNAAPTMLATPSSLLQARGGFALKNLWVTPHSDAERWPAGDYTIQSKGGEGLPLWTKQVCSRRLLCCCMSTVALCMHCLVADW